MHMLARRLQILIDEPRYRRVSEHARSRNMSVGAVIRATILAPLAITTASDLEDGLQLYERYDRLDAADALLAATAVSSGADALVSADAAFADVAELRVAAPGTPAFERLLAS